ncbi:beta-lactamase family protein [Actinomadura sp. ATCC 31491]|uniref:Beta-lactamase family protein n=1 Tax=Actinomadura luzonensis TaxID=2805427 RepID=A0ABT0G207_9ACTN|nr:serine hydrolase domain-containing protein [Actinomadura luzonensis]MCK2218618.1 beta-lactamase family protein [Actinomadura luzonensis]
MSTTEARHDELRQALDRAVAGGGPGVVAELRRYGAPPWYATAGVADLTTGEARRPGEHFRIGSFTKAFVGAVVLRVTGDGKLTLDDTVAAWLPGLVEEHLGGDGTAITVRQLLNHTSGLPDIYPGQEPPPPAAPGERFIYSKANYTIAGLIVEKATGAPLAAEIERRVARPLGLTGTRLPSEGNGGGGGPGGGGALPVPHARHYSAFDEAGGPVPVHDVTDADLSWAGAAGGMVSTTSDLHRFLDALLSGRLLTPEQQREMFTTVPTEGSGWVPDTAYGLGVYSQRLACGVTLWGGGGYIQGSTTYAMGERQGGHALVCNLNGDWNDFHATFTDLYGTAFCPGPAS